MQSIYPKPAKRARSVHSSLANAAGSTLSIALNKDSIIEEHAIAISYSEAFSTPPTSFAPDVVGALVTSVRLTVAGPQSGELISVSGVALALHNRVREQQALVTATLGATTTCDFLLELHYENDAARRDLMCALDSSASTQVQLEITFGTAADSATVFTGGTSSAAPTFGVEVISMDYLPSDFTDASGTLLAEYIGVSSARHYTVEKPANASAAGKTVLSLDVGCFTRDVMIRAVTAAGVASDAIISQISLVINGQVRRTGNFTTFRQLTRAIMGLDATGVILLDWGDDEHGFLDLANVQQAHLELTFTAAGSAKVVQDYTR